MNKYDARRRKLLKLVISVPLGFAFGCKPTQAGPAAEQPLLGPEESLEKLILLLGPWSATDRERGEDFARRFIGASHTGGLYLPGSSALVQSLASRFSNDAMAIREINIRNLPGEEQALLMQLVSQIYSLIEVRFLASNDPPWGVCQLDRLRHTRAPT